MQTYLQKNKVSLSYNIYLILFITLILQSLKGKSKCYRRSINNLRGNNSSITIKTIKNEKGI